MDALRAHLEELEKVDRISIEASAGFLEEFDGEKLAEKNWRKKSWKS